MTGTDLRRRVGEVRRRLAAQGPHWTREGEGDFAKVTVPAHDCDLLRDVFSERVEAVVEIGLAYGSSALAIGEALVSAAAARPRHVIIDPYQASAFSNVGLRLLQAAGLDAIVQLIERPSSIALPQLIGDELVAGAAFVDGSHRFHEVFVDVYFLRKIVRPGGIIVVDDHWWPSVPSQRSISSNRSREIGDLAALLLVSDGVVAGRGVD